MTVYLASGKNYSVRMKVTTIIVDPSGANWVCVLQDSTGKTLFSARGADAVTRPFPVDIDADAFNQQTATNLTAVMLVGI
jgi:hypothetical protein